MGAIGGLWRGRGGGEDEYMLVDRFRSYIIEICIGFVDSVKMADSQ